MGRQFKTTTKLKRRKAYIKRKRARANELAKAKKPAK